MSRKASRTVVLACAVAMTCVVGARPALAAAPAIAVVGGGTVSEDEIVTVVGSGFVAGEVVTIQQCFGSETTCPFAHRSERPPDPLGTFTTRVQVHSFAFVSGVLTCAATGPCFVRAIGSVSGPTPSIPISFDGAFHTDASVSLTPPSPIVSGETSTVRGSNFAPFERVTLKQCYVNDGCAGVAPAVYATTDADGAFVATYTFNDLLPRQSGGPFECQPLGEISVGYCVLEVRSRVHDTVAVQLRFASSRLALVPSTGLRDRTPAVISGVGWIPYSPVAVHLCVWVRGNLRCDDGTVGAIATPNGRIDAQIQLRDHVVLDDRVHSCRVARCALVASQYAFGGPVERIDLEFRRFPATATLASAGPHGPGALVQVELAGWPAGDRVVTRDCVGDSCVEPSAAVTLSTGSGTVVRTLPIWQPPASGSHPGPCPFEFSCSVLVQSLDHPGYERSLALSPGPAGWPGAAGWWTSVVESDGDVCVPIVLLSPAPWDFEIPFVTVDVQAVAGRDYEGRNGVAAFARGSRIGCARVEIFDDDRPEETEAISVRLIASPFTPVGAIPIAGSAAYAFVTDDD